MPERSIWQMKGKWKRLPIFIFLSKWESSITLSNADINSECISTILNNENRNAMEEMTKVIPRLSVYYFQSQKGWLSSISSI